MEEVGIEYHPASHRPNTKHDPDTGTPCPVETGIGQVLQVSTKTRPRGFCKHESPALCSAHGVPGTQQTRTNSPHQIRFCREPSEVRAPGPQHKTGECVRDARNESRRRWWPPRGRAPFSCPFERGRMPIVPAGG